MPQPPAQGLKLVESHDLVEGSGPSTRLGLGTLSTSTEPFPCLLKGLDASGFLVSSCLAGMQGTDGQTAAIFTSLRANVSWLLPSFSWHA